jgi:hypothetical protein
MKVRILVGVVLACFTSSLAFAQNVYVSFSQGHDFSEYHTYAWGQQKNPNQITSPFLAQQAQTQINAQLQSRGLQLVQESQNPDLIVVANGGMKTQTSYNAWGTGGLRWGGGMGTITPEQSVIGTLIVDLYDPKAKELAWRGTAQDTLDQSNSQKNLEKVDKAVVKMFKKYPYPAKSK